MIDLHTILNPYLWIGVLATVSIAGIVIVHREGKKSEDRACSAATKQTMVDFSEFATPMRFEPSRPRSFEEILSDLITRELHNVKLNLKIKVPDNTKVTILGKEMDLEGVIEITPKSEVANTFIFKPVNPEREG